MMLFVLLSAALCGTTFARPQAVSPTVLPIRFGTECYVYAPSQISEALASRCTAVVMQDFKVPKDQTLDLTRLPERMSFTFNGTTTFEPSEDPDFVAIRIGGIKPNIDAIPGSIIYGNGPLFWDGQGPKGGKPKPHNFISIKNVTGGSISNLNIKSTPANAIYIEDSTDVIVKGVVIDNAEGNTPNQASGSLRAAPNSRGISISNSKDIEIRDTAVTTQGECILITSGSNIKATNTICHGGLGFSVGPIDAQKQIAGVLFANSTVSKSDLALKIDAKGNFGLNTTTSVSDVKFTNITLQDIAKNAMFVEQTVSDLSGQGLDSDNVKVTDVRFDQISGTMLCGGVVEKVDCVRTFCDRIEFGVIGVTVATC